MIFAQEMLRNWAKALNITKLSAVSLIKHVNRNLADKCKEINWKFKVTTSGGIYLRTKNPLISKIAQKPVSFLVFLSVDFSWDFWDNKLFRCRSKNWGSRLLAKRLLKFLCWYFAINIIQLLTWTSRRSELWTFGLLLSSALYVISILKMMF